MFKKSSIRNASRIGENRDMNKCLFSSKKQNWETPQWLFDKLDHEFHFTIDVASSKENHKCRRYFTEKEDGLSQDWSNEIVWCNPPYRQRSR